MVMKSAHLLRLVKGRYLFLSLVFVLSTLLSSLSGFFSQNDIASAACASGEKADNGKCYARVGLTGAQNAYNASRWGIKSQEEARNIGAEKDEIDNRFNETHHDILRRERTAATRKTEVENDFNRNNHDILRRQQMAEVDKTNVTNEFDQSSAGKQVDIARREADRTKKRVEADNEFAWHFRNLTDQKSFEGEMQLRNAVEKAATAKIEIDTHHSELKSGETKNIRFTGETIGKLAADANGGVKTDANGGEFLIVDVDATNSVVGFIL